jgi:hypothetical protein
VAEERNAAPLAAVEGEAGPGAGPAGSLAEDGGADGPYDITEAPATGRRLDLGSLRIPSVAGVEVRVQANQDGAVQQVYLVHGESVLQLGVFAAPRTDPIWDEVRAEIRAKLFDDGVAVEEVDGAYGAELRARVRTQEGLKDLRFVGVNGPRWMVRAVFQGPAAVDPHQAGPLAECLRGLVVNRGDQARPVKEPLPLRLSAELSAQLTGAPREKANSAPASTGAATSAASGAAGGPRRRKPSPRPRRPGGPQPSTGGA